MIYNVCLTSKAFLIQKGVDFNQQNDRKENAIYFLMKRERWGILQQLRKLLTNLRIESGSASEQLLFDQCVAMNIVFFKRLFSCQLKFNYGQIFGFAAQSGSLNMLKFFIEDLHLSVNMSDNEG